MDKKNQTNRKKRLGEDQSGANIEINRSENVEKHLVDLTVDADKRGEIGFLVQSDCSKESDVKERVKCDSKLPKPGKSTSSTKCDETQKSKVTKTNTAKHKEGNRFIRALNWVSKLPGKLSAEKQAKKQDHKHEKQSKQQENQEEAEAQEDYGFFIKPNPRHLSERQNQALKKLSEKDDKNADEHDKVEVKQEIVPGEEHKKDDTQSRNCYRSIFILPA